MKRLAIICTALLSLTAILGSTVSAGNGAPQGPHDYQLNIIGMSSDKNDDSGGTQEDPGDWGGEGHRIFVGLGSPTADGGVETRIALIEGDYAVLDANGTDGWASFQLPAPGLDAFIVGDPGDADVESSYSVFVRPLGKPGGWSTITTCADVLDSSFGGLIGNKDTNVIENAIDDVTGAFCSIEQVGSEITLRTAGPSKFQNVTAELTTIVFEVTIWTDLDGDGVVDPGEEETISVRVPIFHTALEGEYWLYDNHGLRLLQVRFYDCSTNVATGESTCFD